MAREDDVPDDSGPAGAPTATVEFLGNYTAFADLRSAVTQPFRSLVAHR